MKTHYFLAIFIAVLSLTNSVFAAKPLKITKNSHSSYVIVVPENGTLIENQAAELLQNYIVKVSGCKLLIVSDKAKPIKTEISIGLTNRFPGSNEKMDPDEFRITTKNQKLSIVGGSHKGIYYGVVDLLEKKLGCRFYAPDAEFVPQNKTIFLKPLNYSDKPVNTLRIVYGQFSQKDAYKDWMRLDNIEEVYAIGYFVHTLGNILPPDTYFSSHPEYFAFMNGKRIPDQLCMSNPDVVKLVNDKLAADMTKQPDKKIWSVSQNDNLSYCQCDKCRAIIDEEGSPSGPLIRFINQVAARFPDKTISTLAYQFSRSAPKITKPAANVQIVLCTIELNRSKSIETDPASQSFVKDITDWGKITHDLYIWDYTVNFTNLVSPFPNLHVLQPNIQFLTRNGAKQHFQQTNTAKGNEMAELKSYLLARLLWNPDVNIDSVKTDFLNGYYAEAAPYIRKYTDRMESELVKSGERLDIFGEPVYHDKSFLSADNIAFYNTLFDKAEAVVVSKPEIFQRVKVSRLPLEFAIMEIAKNDMFGPRGWYSEKSGKFILKPEMKATLEDFNSTCTKNGVKYLNEANLPAETYYNATLHSIDVQIGDDIAFRKNATANPGPDSKYSDGNISAITNGVCGSNNFKVNWLGWENADPQITLDLGANKTFHSINISSLWAPDSWILHPSRVTCVVSADGITWDSAGTTEVAGDQKKEDAIRNFLFTGDFNNKRYIRFDVTATKKMPSWHSSAGNLSWLFLDEIVVK